MQLKFVINVVGVLVCLIAVSQLIPAFVDASFGNPEWKAFLESSSVIGFVGVSVVLATRTTYPAELTTRSAFLITGLCWSFFPLIAAIPFLNIGVSFTDAVFETTSAITTTGSTVLVNIDQLPPGILFWRALLQWIGGIGILVMAIAILPMLRVGGTQLFVIEAHSSEMKIEARWSEIVSKIVQIYVILTVACIGAYWYLGMSGFDAICHAMTTISTGGFSNYDESFGYFQDWRLHWAAIAFMIAGALPFFHYVKAVNGDLSALINSSQVRSFLGFLLIVSIATSIWLNNTEQMGFFEELTLAAFNITSIVTTTGYATTDYTLWGTGAVGAFLVLMFVGGCSGSTTGAIKIYRFQIIGKLIRSHLKRLISPNRILPLSYDGNRVPADVPYSILTFIALFGATIAICTLMLSICGLDLVTAYSASVTAITNVGPGLGPVIGPAGNFSSLPDITKWVLCAAMILGRLELFTLLVMFDRDFWEL